MMTVERWDYVYYWHGRKQLLFQEGVFLQVDEVRKALEEYEHREERMPGMLLKFRNADKYFSGLLSIYRSLTTWSFPVERLRHVTIKKCFLNILHEEAFRGSRITFRLKGERRNLRVSCWGVDIAPDKIETSRRIHFEEFRDKLTKQRRARGDNAEQKMEEKVQDMMANSPAVSQQSRYGNFQFSFRIEDLLTVYKMQHCDGKEPVLRVLGTETFTQEIVHWVLIHSPHCRAFDHLPTVDVQGPLSRDGNRFTWKPESMTDQFTWYMNGTGDLREKRMVPLNGTDGLMQTYDAWVWNNPVFAFYLPGSTALWLGRSSLLNNVDPCPAIESFGGTSSRFLRHPFKKYVSEQKARVIIDNEKSLMHMAQLLPAGKFTLT